MARVAHIFGRRLAHLREERAMTQRELGEAIGGVSDETISRVERQEIAGILAKRIPKLASVLGLTLEDFKMKYCPPESEMMGSAATTGAGGGIADRADLPRAIDLRKARSARVVPEFQIGIAASRRVEKIAEHPDANRLVASSDKRAFTAPVDGDCQHPKWKHGEIVVFSYDAVEREGILPGKSYYIAFTDGSTTFKRLFPDESDPEVYILRCWNRKKYPAEQRVHRDEIVRLARAINKQVVVDEEE